MNEDLKEDIQVASNDIFKRAEDKMTGVKESIQKVLPKVVDTGGLLVKTTVAADDVPIYDKEVEEVVDVTVTDNAPECYW